ncbi:MAG: NUDIX domain-containing protein [Gemmatimonadetes bacterium]|nr:NUDIX domain-containing protein [Gemmatimonadota bacterium]
MGPEMVIPFHRLPPGFAEQLDRPERDAAEPKPAATAVLVRDGADRPEVLLLKRHRSAGFVPGAYVFPGGRVDLADGDPALLEMLGPVPRGAAAEYWLAVVREVFEETGVLLARSADGVACRDASADTALAEWRNALLDGQASLLDVLRSALLRPDISRMVYCSHWITPVAEPKRYDTRFFLAELPTGCRETIDAREMSDAVWFTADEALARFKTGELPMVFPTVKTLQLLQPFASVDAMLDAFRGADVPAVLPRLVRTADGVGIVVPSADEDSQGT